MFVSPRLLAVASTLALALTLNLVGAAAPLQARADEPAASTQLSLARVAPGLISATALTLAVTDYDDDVASHAEGFSMLQRANRVGGAGAGVLAAGAALVGVGTVNLLANSDLRNNSGAVFVSTGAVLVVASVPMFVRAIVLRHRHNEAVRANIGVGPGHIQFSGSF